MPSIAGILTSVIATSTGCARNSSSAAFAARNGDDPKAVLLQLILQHAAEAVVVIDQQNRSGIAHVWVSEGEFGGARLRGARDRQSDPKPAAASGRVRKGFKRAAVVRDDPVRDREPETGALPSS